MSCRGDASTVKRTLRAWANNEGGLQIERGENEVKTRSQVDSVAKVFMPTWFGRDEDGSQTPPTGKMVGVTGVGAGVVGAEVVGAGAEVVGAGAKVVGAGVVGVQLGVPTAGGFGHCKQERFGVGVWVGSEARQSLQSFGERICHRLVALAL